MAGSFLLEAPPATCAGGKGGIKHMPVPLSCLRALRRKREKGTRSCVPAIRPGPYP